MRGNKATPWEGGHRSPLFVRWPSGGLRPPGDVSGLTQVQDLVPTLIGLCGLKQTLDAKFDGINLTPQQLDDVTTYPLITNALKERGYSKKDITKLKDKIELYPGMPAQVFIITGSRSLISYLFTPISDSAYKAFREE
jgi:arylsulfatase A-like enzyme